MTKLAHTEILSPPDEFQWACPFCRKYRASETQLKRHIRKHIYRHEDFNDGITGPKQRGEHTEILSPALKWGPEAFRERHLSDPADDVRVFDPRCPRCVQDWAEGKVK